MYRMDTGMYHTFISMHVYCVFDRLICLVPVHIYYHI